MTQKFDPAAHDKYATNVREAVKADHETHSELEAGLVGSFPASDPASSVQPSPSKPAKKAKNDTSRESPSLFAKLRATFR